jgi:hypothetical protein
VTYHACSDCGLPCGCTNPPDVTCGGCIWCQAKRAATAKDVPDLFLRDEPDNWTVYDRRQVLYGYVVKGTRLFVPAAFVKFNADVLWAVGDLIADLKVGE